GAGTRQKRPVRRKVTFQSIRERRQSVAAVQAFARLADAPTGPHTRDARHDNRRNLPGDELWQSIDPLLRASSQEAIEDAIERRSGIDQYGARDDERSGAV